jgi:hypothetical protein
MRRCIVQARYKCNSFDIHIQEATCQRRRRWRRRRFRRRRRRKRSRRRRRRGP